MPATSYKIWQWGNRVPDGVMGSYHVGIAGVAKRADEQSPFAVANEVLCGHLGRGIWLPIPPGFVVEKDGIAHHVSLNFNLAGEQLPPANPTVIVRECPDLVWGIVLFDIWVVNTDRHRRNLAYDRTTKRVHLFDHSHAFLREPEGLPYLEKHKDALGIGDHCLAPVLTSLDKMQEWNERIQAIPEFWIEEALKEAAQVGLSREWIADCRVFLLERREKLVTLVQTHQHLFPKIPAHLWNTI